MKTISLVIGVSVTSTFVTLIRNLKRERVNLSMDETPLKRKKSL